MLRIGLISDTHGLLRPEAEAALAGCDGILHAGDIGDAGILERLARIAPVTAVRGNNDTGSWAADIPETVTVVLAGVRIHVLHDLAALALDPTREGIAVVMAGHSHRPLVRESGGVLYVNPGSAGPRRFKLPVSVAQLRLEAGGVSARVIELQVVPQT